MTTDSLFTLRMFPAQSEEQAREIAAQGSATSSMLELRILPVDAAGQVIAVADPAEVDRVMLDLRVLPADTAEAGDTSGHALPPQRPSNPDPRPMAPSRVLQIAPGVALRLPVADPASVDDQDAQGFRANAETGANVGGGGQHMIYVPPSPSHSGFILLDYPGAFVTAVKTFQNLDPFR